MCIVYTGRISLKSHPAAVDTTMKSGSGVGRVFAPTKQLVFGHKAGQGDSRFQSWKPLTDAEYTMQYLDLLRSRFRQNPQPFRNLLEREEVILLCYCKAHGFCHRYILAETVLPKCARYFDLPFDYGGEYVKEEKA
jgi:uncharacterized protein YeaO (DUF488 family)